MDIETAVARAFDNAISKIEGELHKDVERAVTDWAEHWVHHHHGSKPKAVSAQLVIGGSMPGDINVDTTNETVTINFVDDKGDTNASPPAAPSGSALQVTFNSDTPSVVTVASDSDNPLQGDITVVGEGTATIGATLGYADGSPVVEADGSTPFPPPSPVTVTVSAGAAVGDALTLSV